MASLAASPLLLLLLGSSRIHAAIGFSSPPPLVSRPTRPAPPPSSPRRLLRRRRGRLRNSNGDADSIGDFADGSAGSAGVDGDDHEASSLSSLPRGNVACDEDGECSIDDDPPPSDPSCCVDYEPPPEPEDKLVFLISDGTGATVKQSVRRSLEQFDDASGTVRTRLFTFVQGEETAQSIIRKARQRDAILITTVRVRVLREKILRMCALEGVPALDLIGPSLDLLEGHLERLPVNVPSMYDPGQVQVLNDSYYRRIDALQFTLKADDGQSPWLLGEADVVLVGVSRSGKTPLGVTLSQSTGWKVANVPLVPECPPPKELLDGAVVDPRRVFCLTVAPSQLKRIREARLANRLGVTAVEERRRPRARGSGLYDGDEGRNSNYADRAYIMRDLKHAHDRKEEMGWTQIDVTGRAVEDTASEIAEIVNERFADAIAKSGTKDVGNFISLN